MTATTDGKGASTDTTVQQLIAIHAEHHRNTTPAQRLANRVTLLLARPATLVAVLLLIATWMIGNEVARYFGSAAFEAFPFPDLAFLATISALLIALLILTTQRHSETLAERRAQLTLQIALLSEKKIAKVIALIEEQRRDNPLLYDRRDIEADQLAQAADPKSQLGQIDAGLIPDR